MSEHPIEYECPGCDAPLTADETESGCRVPCPHCKNINIVPELFHPAELSPMDLIGEYLTDVRNKIFWLVIAILLVMAGLPAAMTRLFGQPTAGLEDVFTVWNIAWLTFPMTLGVAIASVIFLASDETYRETKEFWFWIIGTVVAAAFIGGALGQFQLSRASETIVSTAEKVVGDVMPENESARNMMLRGGAHAAAPIVRPRGRFLAIVFLVGSFALLLFNYFTLYGPAAFISSILVGAFAGWLAGVKIPQLWNELTALPRSPQPNTTKPDYFSEFNKKKD